MSLYNYTEPRFFRPCDGLGAKASYSLRKLHRNVLNTKAIRVRDDTGAETDIGFSGQNLDSAGLLAWLGRNQVASVPLGVDSNADGVSDGWSKILGSGNTVNFTIDQASQKMELSESTTLTYSYARTSTKYVCVAGNTISITCNAKKISAIGTVKVLAGFVWRKSDDSIITTNESEVALTDNADFATKTIILTAPALAGKFEVHFAITATTIGDTGSAWFKDASATIANQSATIAKWYDQSGNNNHAIQSDPTKQPRIVNAGVLDVDASSRACIQTILANDTHLVVADSNTLDFTTNSTYSFVHNPANFGEGSAGRIIDKGTAYVVNLASTSKLINNATIGGDSSDGCVSFNSQNVNTILHNDIDDTCKYYSNGSLNAQQTAVTIVVNTTNLYLFNRADLTRQYNGKFSELILFGKTLTDAERTKLEANQKKYYGVA